MTLGRRISCMLNGEIVCVSCVSPNFTINLESRWLSDDVERPEIYQVWNWFNKRTLTRGDAVEEDSRSFSQCIRWKSLEGVINSEMALLGLYFELQYIDRIRHLNGVTI